jgi:hypothetical protein
VSFRVHTGTGSAPSDLHITVDAGPPFPANDWRDYPVIVLTWWLNGYRALRDGGAPVTNSFMNGPFAFQAALTDTGELTLQFLRRTPGEDAETGPPATVPTDEYRAELLNAAEAVADATPPNDPDLPALRAAIRSLRAPSELA